MLVWSLLPSLSRQHLQAHPIYSLFSVRRNRKNFVSPPLPKRALGTLVGTRVIKRQTSHLLKRLPRSREKGLYEIECNEWIDNFTVWPPVEIGDTYSYLVETPCRQFTKERIKRIRVYRCFQVLYQVVGYVFTYA